jgi:Mrp family chromosome partitioning ATPase
MTWAILTINIKGGTGKSTIAEELTKKLRDRGHDVGVLDGDIDSANLATRFGVEEKVTFEGDHRIKPVEHEGFKLYSMENAFEESSFSQSGEFMGDVVEGMIQNSEWGDLDYLVVDCPPGSSDVFDSIVSALRPNILGAVSVGISDALDDTARLVKVCNHNWIPIISFVENMSGVYCHGGEVSCSHDEVMEGHPVQPFGAGNTEQFCSEIGGNFSGEIPLCVNCEVSEVADDTIDSVADDIEDAEQPKLPEDNTGDKGFISNVLKSVIKGVQKINNEIPIEEIQDRFGVEGREPLVVEIEITDAGPISGVFSTLVMTVDDGDIKVLREKKAKRKQIKPEGGMKISSQNLYNAIEGEKKVMRSVTGELTTEPYSIVDAVKMGDAEVWGDKTINRLSVLDTILNEVVPMSEVQKAMKAD